jgi:hypothetical protein
MLVRGSISSGLLPEPAADRKNHVAEEQTYEEVCLAGAQLFGDDAGCRDQDTISTWST